MSSELVMPVLILTLLCSAEWKRVPMYDLFVSGARKGLNTAIQVLPNLAAMLCAVSLMQSSGLMEALGNAVSPLLRLMGLPAEVGPLMLMRPVSGSGALAVLEGLLERFGADSRIGLIACTVMGSSETVFYTLCVYTCGVKNWNTGYAVWCSLAGALAGTWLAGMLF